MKNVKKIGGGGCKSNKKRSLLALIALVAIVAVSGLSMVACDDDDGGGGGGIDGTWRNTEMGGMEVNVSGSSGTIRTMGNPPNLRWQDAISKDYIRIGTEYWQNIKSTGSNSWSGKILQVRGLGNTASGTTYSSCTFSLSYDGRNLTVRGSDANGSYTEYWYR